MLILEIFKHCDHISYFTAVWFIFPAYFFRSNGICKFFGLMVTVLNIIYEVYYYDIYLYKCCIEVVSGWFDFQACIL